MKSCIILVTVCLLLGATPGLAQISAGGIPLGMNDESVMGLLNQGVQTFTLPALDNEVERISADAVKQAECGDCKKEYYGKGIELNIDIIQEGTFELREDNSRVWLTRIQSPTAYALQFHFKEFSIPHGASLYIYNEDQSMILGAYTSDNNPEETVEEMKFGVEYIQGNSIILEYHEPDWVTFAGTIKIGRVVHVFRDMFALTAPDYGTGGPCQVNVACTTHTAGWEDEISSVALIQLYSKENDLAGLCSGVLVNNTERSGEPLFLTASHCADAPASGPAQDNYAIWVFKFGHQTNACEPPSGYVYDYYGFSVSGAKLVARQHPNGPQSDYLLLKLSTKLEEIEENGICYAGWVWSSQQNGVVNQAFGIHHPRGDVKKFCRTDQQTASTEYGGSTPNIAYDHIKVLDWDLGAVEPGSSGSPLFNSSQQIIGQLHGGAGLCNGADGTNGEAVWYGKMWSAFQDQDFADALHRSISSVPWVETWCPKPPPDLTSGACPASLNDGMAINGNTAFGTVPCINTHVISLSPVGPCESPQWKWQVNKKKFRCNNIPSEFSMVSLCPPQDLIHFFCECEYHSYEIQVVETDANQNVIGTVYSTWINAPVGFIDEEVVINNTTWAKLGMTMHPGSYYRIQLKSNFQQNLSTRRHYRFMPNNILETGTIGTDLAAQQSITMVNATVTQPIEVVAGSSIRILQTSGLQAGHYRIASAPFCDFQKRGLPSEEVVRDVPETIAPGLNPNVIVYPNPTSGRFSLDVSEFAGAVDVEVVNSLGQTVFRYTDVRPTLAIDLSGEAEGVYFLRISSGATIVSRKVVKQ